MARETIRLFFAIGGVFYCGNKIHTGGYDSEFNDIAQVRVKKRHTKIIKSKISESLSNFIEVTRMKINTI